MSDINTSKHSDAGKKKQRKSSFFARARASFMRTGGTRGGSAENLRGTKGSDFEAYGRISRGEGGGMCGCFGRGDATKDEFLLIKGPFCFVFVAEDSPSPKYAVGLQFMKAVVNGTHVGLENNLGDQAYEFIFETEDVAKEFKASVEVQAASAEAEIVRKRLGHDMLLQKRSSVVFAEGIAKAKEADQPDAPVSTKEIIANMPVDAY